MAIAAIGTAFEASYGWRLVHHGHELAAGFFKAGSMGLLESFVHEAEVHTDHIGPAEFQLFGDDPSGQRPPGLDTQTVPVIVIAGMRGHLVHQVARGDTLHAIARQYGTDVRGPVIRCQDSYGPSTRRHRHVTGSGRAATSRSKIPNWPQQPRQRRGARGPLEAGADSRRRSAHAATCWPTSG